MPMKLLSEESEAVMVCPALVLEAGAGARIVKRASRTNYRPGVRPLRSNEAGAEIPTVVVDLL